jgi:signal transduction histidine kinase
MVGYVVVAVVTSTYLKIAPTAFSLLPVLIAGWYFGLRAGLAAGLFASLANLLVLSSMTSLTWEDLLSRGGFGSIMIIIVGLVVGRLHNLGEQLRDELRKRSQIEQGLQESETRFRTLVEQSPFSTQIFRPDGSVLMLNNAFSMFWNASPEDTNYVVEHYNILQDEQLEASGLMPFIKRGFAGAFTEIPTIYYDPYQTQAVRDTQLKPKWVAGYIWPVRDKAGVVQQVVLMHEDITERKQVEAQQLELARSRERAELLKELLNTLSHDLKTPLTIINTSLYLLEQTTEPAYQKSKLDNIKAQAQQLEKLIQDILTTSYLESAVEIELKPLDLNLMIRQLVARFQPIAEARSLTVAVELAQAVPVIDARAPDLQRMLTNLIENAVRYTPVGGSITIQTYVKTHEVVVEVRDTGIGIASEDLPYIFEAFYRADKARSTDTGGAGLGLSIVKKIVEKHRGRIEVESSLGSGTTFRIWFPTASRPSMR